MRSSICTASPISRRRLPREYPAHPARWAARLHSEGKLAILPVFELIRSANKCEMEDLFYTYNMGIGMVIAVPREQADAVLERANALGEKAYRIGTVVCGEHGVELCG